MTTPLALLYHEGHTREHEPLLYTSVGSYDLRVGVGSWDQRAPAVGSMLRHAGLEVRGLRELGWVRAHGLGPWASRPMGRAHGSAHRPCPWGGVTQEKNLKGHSQKKWGGTNFKVGLFMGSPTPKSMGCWLGGQS